MDSYTGKVYTSNTISDKLFKHSDIPFNKYSHWMFGDKYLIKSHLKRGIRSKIFIKSSKEKWKFFNDSKFQNKVKDMVNFSEFNFHPY